MTVTSLLVITLATFAEAVSMMWHEGEEIAQTNQQARVALTHLRREVGDAVYVSTPYAYSDTLALWARDDVEPYGRMNLSEIVIIAARYDHQAGRVRLMRVSQNPPSFWNFSYTPADAARLLSDWGVLSLLKYWCYAQPATLAEGLAYDASSVQFTLRTTPDDTAYDPSSVRRFVDFQFRVELNPTQGSGAGATNRELVIIDGTAQAKNHRG